MPPDIFLLSSRNIDGKFSWTFGKRCGIMRSKGAENMDFQHIHKLMEELNKREIPEEIRQKIEDEFEIDYTYDSLALSGSSVTREEVKTILTALKNQEGGNK